MIDSAHRFINLKYNDDDIVELVSKSYKELS